MTDLNKIYNGDELWETKDYLVTVSVQTGSGYDIRNKNTGAVEGYVDQEPAAIMSALYLQDAYDEVMDDPVREYKLRKQRQDGARMAKSTIVN